MVAITYKNHGVSITDVWFAEDTWNPLKNEINTDIIRLHGHNNKQSYLKWAHRQYTLITDLSKTHEELMEGIKNKNTKYEIRRSFSDDIKIQYYAFDEILHNDNMLEAFSKCYDDMFKLKGIRGHFNKKVIKSYASAGVIIISVVYHNELPIVFHSYVVEGEKARFYHSCSSFREDKSISQLIGRANKRLHWEDWIYLKERGIKEYDWGGVFSPDSSEDGIDRFKKSFGGKEKEYFYAQIPVSLLGKIICRLLEREK